MIQVDNLAEMAEELRRCGVEACHEILYGPHGGREGLDVGDDFFPLWELILPREPGSPGATGFRGHQGSPRSGLVGGPATVRSVAFEDRSLTVAARTAARFRALADEGVDHRADHHDHQAGPRGGRPVGEQHVQHHRRADDVQRRHERVSRHLVGPRQVRPLAPQLKHAGDGQDVEEQRRGDHVVEQIAVEIAVLLRGGVVGARQHQHRRSRCLAPPATSRARAPG